MDTINDILVADDRKETNLLDVSGLGPRRSIIRRIGSQLPLGFAARPTFELLPNGSHILKTSGKKTSMFSLADVMQLDDMPDSSVPIRASASVPNLNDTTSSEFPILSSISVTSSASQDHMVTKLSALEDELAFLRTQIAALVTTQQQQANVTASSFNVSISSNLEPLSTSTPVKAPPMPPGIPPPPPPPPPPPICPPQQTKKVLSIQEVIRQRKIAKGECPPPLTPGQRSKSSVPDMADILKDLHKVKLKSVSRSPGGTPFNRKKGDNEPVSGDPVSLIAAALKKKFAHRKNFGSPKVEDVEDSFEFNLTPRQKNYESPDATPKFGQHLLKRRNTSPAPSLTPKPKLPSFLKTRKDLENTEPAS